MEITKKGIRRIKIRVIGKKDQPTTPAKKYNYDSLFEDFVPRPLIRRMSTGKWVQRNSIAFFPFNIYY